tara:strand:+ start:268 stop:786 length:519 start_codon:yes stop_codon:yes gene_type:complete
MSGVELLVGAAASGTAGTAGFTAATGGLFGAGGAVTAGASFSTLATAVSVIGAIQGATSTAAAADYNRKLAIQNAIASNAAAAQQVERQRRLSLKRAGANRAHDPDKLDLLEDSAIEEELAIQDTLHAGATQFVGFGNNANLERSKARNARVGGGVTAFGTLLGGAGERFAT